MDTITRPILRIGKTNDGRFDFTKENLDSILKNTNQAIKDGHRISVKLGHFDNNQISKGWVKNLRWGDNEHENALIGDFENLTDEIKLAIKDDRLPQVSAEISPRFITKSGYKIGELLNSVALCGIDRPAIHFTATKTDDKENNDENKKENKQNKQEDYSMNFEEEYKKLTADNANIKAEMITLKAEMEVKDNKIKSFEEDIIIKDKEIKDLKTENESLKPHRCQPKTKNEFHSLIIAPN